MHGALDRPYEGGNCHKTRYQTFPSSRTSPENSGRPVYTAHITGLSSVAGGRGRAGGRVRASRPLTRGAAAHAPPRRRRAFRRGCGQQPQWPQRPPASSAPSKMGRVLDSHAGVRAGTGAGGSTGRPRWRRIFSITAWSSMVANSRSWPPHSGQARTSMAGERNGKPETGNRKRQTGQRGTSGLTLQPSPD